MGDLGKTLTAFGQLFPCAFRASPELYAIDLACVPELVSLAKRFEHWLDLAEILHV